MIFKSLISIQCITHSASCFRQGGSPSSEAIQQLDCFVLGFSLGFIINFKEDSTGYSMIKRLSEGIILIVISDLLSIYNCVSKPI